MTKEWKRMGVLIPPVNITVEREFNRWAPPGVTIHAQRMFRSRAVLSPDDLKDMLKYLDDDCRRLAFARPDFVMYACTSGSSLETGGYDDRISERIANESGTPASTTSTAVATALRCLGVKKMAVVTPYPKEINDKEMAFFADLGFDPVSLESFLQGDSYEIPMISQDDTRALVEKADREDADGVFISCTNLATADIIEPLERELGKPVVTSNQATFWMALRKMGIDDSAPGCGRLLNEPLP
ncbi:MAG: aspartate/glutamate racemase family protein [SAR202 cluster bacterium]|jgi:maleate cis-trans isomerase|nr:aspartate/glutamate racemase family protein [SAR202 cluster bacterium]MDP6300334.1 aspartate/glutamate racemase family protein [SAR202 cluster bacterium]MDP7103108.1 aspartate/glutamate racemase family protein [SAR202 cluster bacterium]MDP7224527.1 aspartate/glutamate racemase family protein [SAR202 cluster bacterium]MDP7414088.1 aspartate/glutamate racemase family protein [SAR202 cluster bacterium]|tara:strand:+ start:13124 stop:13849 length:726 start_codon:yes stop_codon:yes gene_type:complete